MHRRASVKGFLTLGIAGAGTLGVLSGGLALSGWYLPRITDLHIVPVLVTMPPPAAAAFILFGLALIAVSVQRPVLAYPGAIYGLLLGALTVIEYGFGWNLQIDLFLGRMALNTAVCVLLIGSVLFLMARPRPFKNRLSILVIGGSLVSALSGLVFYGYLFGTVELHTLVGLFPMAVETAGVLYALGTGILLYTARDSLAESDRATHWLAYPLGIAGFTCILFLWSLLLGQLSEGAWQPNEVQAASSAFFVATLLMTALLILALRLAQNARQRETQAQAVNAKLQVEIDERQRIESQLHEALTLNRRIIETATVGLLIYRADSGQCVMANQAAAQAVGTSIDHLQAQDFRTIESWKISGLLALAEQVLIDGRDRRADFHITTTFGKDLWLDGMFSRISHDGQPHLLFMLVDITERKQAEETLAQERNLLRALMDNIPDAIYFKDSQSRFVLINWAQARRFGLSDPMQALGKTDFDYFTAEHAQPAYDDEQAILRTGEPLVDKEEKETWPNGQENWVSATKMPHYDSSGHIIGTFGISRDITERRRAEEALKYRAAQLALLADVGAKIAAILDLNSVLDRAAHLVHEYFGYHHVALFTLDREQGELVMRARAGKFANLFPIEHRIRLGQGVVGWAAQRGDRLLANDVRVEPRYFNRYPDRIPTQAELSVPIRVGTEIVGVLDVQSPHLKAFDENDVMVLEALVNQIAIAIENSRLYDAVQRELTARAQAEADLRQAKEAAEAAAASAAAANHAKSAFLANMSHELRTPLNAILGFSDLMARDRQLSVEQRENLSIINRSGAHLLHLINDVLDMAKIESGRLTLQDESFDLHRILEGLVEMFYLRAVEKGLTLIVDRAPEVPRYVRADQGKLRQVLINLLGNAVKFTAQGGIGLRIRLVGPSATTCRLEFEVQDTGPGIAPNELDSIFEPFVQLTDGVKSQSGTGLGLSISRQFARLMGGDLVASNADVPGLGALFTFTVPVRVLAATDLSPETQPARPTAIGLQPGQPTYRLLVIEDNEESRTLMVKLLTQLGFEVRAAINGLEGVNTWREWQPHLIWMDMRMPIMDGHEATRRIKATTSGQTTVIIALTASAFEDERAQVLAGGCDDYIRKPFHPSEIVDKLSKYLGVQFVYAPDAAAEAARPLRTADQLDLTGLPDPWLCDLQIAVIESDPNRILTLIDQIRDERPALAAALTDLTNDFNFAAILDAIQHKEDADDCVATG